MSEITFDRIWELNPNGDKKMTQMSINGTMSIDHTFNLELLYKSYRQYLAFWQSKFGERDPKYVPGKDQLKTIADFVSERLYHNQYKLPRNNRDLYLYGKHKQEELQEYFDNFRKLEPTWKSSTERLTD